MTIAAITPPEGRREELFVSPARADSAGTDEVTPPFAGMLVLPETGVWRTVLDATAVVVRVDIGGDDDDDSMIFDEAESTELGTRVERGNPPGIDCVVIEVEPPTTAPVSVSPMLDVCALAATAACTGVLVIGSVVRTVGPSWP
jgi:hypothetical protein